jgi:hypothetical protein
MIDIAMKFFRDYLNQQITSPVNPAVLGNITKESDIDNGKIHLSLIQVEEEKVLKEVNHRRRINPGDDFYTTINPEIRLNLYVLVTYQYGGKNYEEALKQLSNVVTVLQGKYVFSKPDFMKPAYEPLEQIVLDLYTQTIDQNSNMWQALGEKLSPSLLYKMRVIGIQANKVLDTTAEIRAIGLDVVHKPFD